MNLENINIFLFRVYYSYELFNLYDNFTFQLPQIIKVSFLIYAPKNMDLIGECVQSASPYDWSVPVPLLQSPVNNCSYVFKTDLKHLKYRVRLQCRIYEATHILIAHVLVCINLCSTTFKMAGTRKQNHRGKRCVSYGFIVKLGVFVPTKLDCVPRLT